MLENLIDNCLINSGDRVAVGVSGGADSMVLLCALKEKQKKLDFYLKAINVNHHLRGEESDRDSEFVKNFCEKNKIDYAILNVDVNFLCSIHSDVSVDSNVVDLKTLSYVVNPVSDNDEKLTYSADTGIVQQISKNTNQTVFRIYIQWDDEAGTMDNQADTEAATNDNSKALMNVTLQFSQLNQ